jgi:hypothetical protein
MKFLANRRSLLAWTAQRYYPHAIELAVQRPVVVELFTSEVAPVPASRCLSGELVKQATVIGLSYHVDYWDYLGWRDTLASPEAAGGARALGGRTTGSTLLKSS